MTDHPVVMLALNSCSWKDKVGLPSLWDCMFPKGWICIDSRGEALARGTRDSGLQFGEKLDSRNSFFQLTALRVGKLFVFWGSLTASFKVDF